MVGYVSDGVTIVYFATLYISRYFPEVLNCLHYTGSRKFWKKMLKGAECLGFRDVVGLVGSTVFLWQPW